MGYCKSDTTIKIDCDLKITYLIDVQRSLRDQKTISKCVCNDCRSALVNVEFFYFIIIDQHF